MWYNEGIDPGFTDDHPFNRYCIYCGATLMFSEINKVTGYSIKDFKKDLRSNKIFVTYREPDDSFILDESYYDKSEKNFRYENTFVGQCITCGWWKITEEFLTYNNNIWQIFFEKVGAIKEFDERDLSVPIQEIRDHLTRKYNDRLYIHPRLFENVVASVFSDLVYQSVCTAYSNDGGIDVVLSTNGFPIAVQVKRTKNKIKVEQVRAFLGALVINKYKRGLFVSTVDYQSGCQKIANNHGIELINGDRFYNILKEAQIIQHYTNFDVDYSQYTHLYYTGSMYMNSL